MSSVIWFISLSVGSTWLLIAACYSSLLLGGSIGSRDGGDATRGERKEPGRLNLLQVLGYMTFGRITVNADCIDRFPIICASGNLDLTFVAGVHHGRNIRRELSQEQFCKKLHKCTPKAGPKLRKDRGNQRSSDGAAKKGNPCDPISNGWEQHFKEVVKKVSRARAESLTIFPSDHRQEIRR